MTILNDAIIIIPLFVGIIIISLISMNLVLKIEPRLITSVKRSRLVEFHELCPQRVEHPSPAPVPTPAPTPAPEPVRKLWARDRASFEWMSQDEQDYWLNEYEKQQIEKQYFI